MNDFYRFPRTPHIAWFGSATPRNDKVLTAAEATSFLASTIVVEEKIDGANVGFSVDEDGVVRAQNRGAYLSFIDGADQFKPLKRWLGSHSRRLAQALYPDLVLFGEWCYAVHTIPYNKLPDWFLAFDVFDRASTSFWSTDRRDDFVADLGRAGVPRLGSGSFDVRSLRALLGRSLLGDNEAEGLYLRQDEGSRLGARAKLVQPQFVQSLGEHWSKSALRINHLADVSARDSPLGPTE